MENCSVPHWFFTILAKKRLENTNKNWQSFENRENSFRFPSLDLVSARFTSFEWLHWILYILQHSHSFWPQSKRIRTPSTELPCHTHQILSLSVSPKHVLIVTTTIPLKRKQQNEARRADWRCFCVVPLECRVIQFFRGFSHMMWVRVRVHERTRTCMCVVANVGACVVALYAGSFSQPMENDWANSRIFVQNKITFPVLDSLSLSTYTVTPNRS